MGGVAPCSKALRKLELRKRESLLIHAVPTFSQLVLRLNWETLWLKPDTHFLVTATPSLSLLSVWVCIVSQRKAFLVSISSFFLFLLAQVTALEEEVRHLNCTIRAHKEEACQLSEKVSDIEHLREQKEKEQQQLQEQLRIKEQQVKRNSLLFTFAHFLWNLWISWTLTGKSWNRLTKLKRNPEGGPAPCFTADWSRTTLSSAKCTAGWKTESRRSQSSRTV